MGGKYAQAHAAMEIQAYAPFRLLYADWKKPSAEELGCLRDWLAGYPDGYAHLGLDKATEQQIAAFVDFEGTGDAAALKFELAKLADIAMQQVPEVYGHEVKRILEVQLSSAVHAEIVLSDDDEPLSGVIIANVAGEELRRDLPEQFMRNIAAGAGIDPCGSASPRP